MHKAQTGGEIGANGEFYKGGQFVADNPETIKGSGYIPRGPRKVCVAPYKWEEADGKTFGIFGELGDAVRYATKWVDGEDGQRKPIHSDFCLALPIECYDTEAALRSRATHGTLKLRNGYETEAWFKRWRNYYGTLLAKWLAGERFIGIEELANLAAVCKGQGHWGLEDFVTIDTADADACEALVASSATVEDEMQMHRRLTSGKGYVGTEGEKMTLSLTLTDSIPYEGLYGFGTVYKFTDAEGNDLAWKTSARLTDANGNLVSVGDTVTLQFTVKSHDEYRDTPQTNISRVKAVA